MTKAIETFNPSGLTTDVLQAYDQMMLQVALSFEDLAPLAVWIWSSVLKELAERGRVTLMSGSFDDVENALINRDYGT